MKPLKGVFTALVTPFRNGTVDTDAWQRLLERQVEAGVHGVVVAGTTGESPTLSVTELEQLMRHASEQKNHFTLVMGVGGNHTAEVIERSRLAKEWGADAVLAVTPYYNKPPAWSVLAHFRAVADQSALPVILYNVPARTNVDLSPDQACALFEKKNIISLKEASGNVARFSEILSQVTRPEISLLSGDDPLFLPSLAGGAHGIISVLSNVWPEPWVQLYESFVRGKTSEAQQIFQTFAPLQKILFSVTNPIGIKWFGAQRGFWEDECRLPLLSLSSPEAPSELKNSFARFLQESPL